MTAPKLVFPCSGASDVGGLTDRAARQMTLDRTGKMYCLAGIGGRVEGILANTRAAAKVLVIDGCPQECAPQDDGTGGLQGFPASQALRRWASRKDETRVTAARIRKVAAKGAELRLVEVLQTEPATSEQLETAGFGRLVERQAAKWLACWPCAIGFAVYRMKFAPVPVMVTRSPPGPVVAEVMGTGTLEARVKTTISPRIQERLAEVLVDQNDAVKAGQLLARLDDGELKRQVEVAEAALAAAKATAERVRVDEGRAQAVELQARQDHKRISDLLSTKISSQAEMDKAVEQLSVAEADLKRAQAATVEAQQQVITAEKNLAYQKERLSFTRILSPYDGLVMRRDRDPGGVVVPGSSMLQLISTNEIWVSAWVDETAIAGLADRPGCAGGVPFRAGQEVIPAKWRGWAAKPTARRASSWWTCG